VNDHFLVCPFNDTILSQLTGRSLVVRIDTPEKIPDVVQASERFGFHLHCVLVKTSEPLSEITMQSAWRGIPIALFTPEMGPFPKFISQLPVLRSLNIRIYLSTDKKENYTSIRILSSLNIETAVVFDEEGLNWDLMGDLMTYAFFGLVHHASIAPFHYAAERYDRQRRTDFSSVYFNDPQKYLHLSLKGSVALTKEEERAGNFITGDINEIDNIENYSDYQSRLEKWRDFFLEPNGCAFCQGWRVCLGKFSSRVASDAGCKKFFPEFMDAIEQYLSLRNSGQGVWQP